MHPVANVEFDVVQIVGGATPLVNRKATKLPPPPLAPAVVPTPDASADEGVAPDNDPMWPMMGARSVPMTEDLTYLTGNRRY
jgi:hypothetical protein